MFTYDEIIEKLEKGTEAELQLNYEDACELQKMLIKRGYVVLMSAGDIGDDYKVEWIYAGNTGSLDYANSNNVVFSHKDYLYMLLDKEYEVEDEE